MTSIGFTGHRQLPNDPTLPERLISLLEQLISEGATEFYAGGAIGWDMLCERTVLQLRAKHPHIHLHLVLPCPPAEQTARWGKALIAEYYRILAAADSVETVCSRYTDACMKKRNERLVELSEAIVCYCSSFRSGTAQTIRIAQSKNIRIIHLSL